MPVQWRVIGDYPHTKAGTDDIRRYTFFTPTRNISCRAFSQVKTICETDELDTEVSVGRTIVTWLELSVTGTAYDCSGPTDCTHADLDTHVSNVHKKYKKSAKV